MSSGDFDLKVIKKISSWLMRDTDISKTESIAGFLFAIPYLLLFIVFLLYPLFKGLYMSLFKWSYFTPSQSEFIGIDNYVMILSDPVFWNAFINTCYFVVLTVPLIVIVSLLVALGINQNIYGNRFLRFVYFSPYILTISVVAVVWVELYSYDGVIMMYLNPFFSEIPLGSELLALPALGMTTVWWQVGFNFAILLAARQTVPDRLYEAAKLDGAGVWHMFWDITLPQMKNALFFVIIAATILQFQVFGQPFIMTQGGPSGSTTTLVYYLYVLGFQRRQLGYAAAVGYILLVVLIVVSVINYKLIGINNNG